MRRAEVVKYDCDTGSMNCVSRYFFATVPSVSSTHSCGRTCRSAFTCVFFPGLCLRCSYCIVFLFYPGVVLWHSHSKDVLAAVKTGLSCVSVLFLFGCVFVKTACILSAVLSESRIRVFMFSFSL